MDVKTIGIACDHAGYPLKKYVVQYLEEHGYKYKDYGTYSDLSCDYPDFAHALAEGLESGEVYPGIGICGSGEGMAITLNKHQGVRAGLAWCKDIAALIRQHNDANAIDHLRGRTPPAPRGEDSREGIIQAHAPTAQAIHAQHVTKAYLLTCKRYAFIL